MYLLDVNTKKSTVLTDDKYDHGSGAQSPDSKEIIYVQYGEGSQLMVMSRNGHHKRALLSNKQDIEHPHWSPDGAKIAFVVRKNSDSSIVVYDIQTKHEHEIIDHVEKWSNVAWTKNSQGLIYTTKNRTLEFFDLVNETRSLVPNSKKAYDPFVFQSKLIRIFNYWLKHLLKYCLTII